MLTDWTLFDYIPGVRRVWVRDAGEEWEFITEYLNAEATKAANAAIREETEGKRFGDYRPLLSMPPNEMRATGVEEAIRQGDDRFLARFFNDGDNAGYRTSRGRL